jgi:hypothetical protein
MRARRDGDSPRRPGAVTRRGNGRPGGGPARARSHARDAVVAVDRKGTRHACRTRDYLRQFELCQRGASQPGSQPAGGSRGVGRGVRRARCRARTGHFHGPSPFRFLVSFLPRCLWRGSASEACRSLLAGTCRYCPGRVRHARRRLVHYAGQQRFRVLTSRFCRRRSRWPGKLLFGLAGSLGNAWTSTASLLLAGSSRPGECIPAIVMPGEPRSHLPGAQCKWPVAAWARTVRGASGGPAALQPRRRRVSLAGRCPGRPAGSGAAGRGS